MLRDFLIAIVRKIIYTEKTIYIQFIDINWACLRQKGVLMFNKKFFEVGTNSRQYFS